MMTAAKIPTTKLVQIRAKALPMKEPFPIGFLNITHIINVTISIV